MVAAVSSSGGAGGLMSTTAPGKLFASRMDLANHYKSDWHKYNLKRREAGMAMLEEEDFNARLEAALALRKEREGRAARTGTDHLKNKNSSSKRNKQQEKKQNQGPTTQQPQNNDNNDAAIGNSTVSDDTSQDETNNVANTSSSDAIMEEKKEEEGPPTIDPRQCLFDNHMCVSVEANVNRMYKKYGFFIPDREYLVDLEGLIGYCAEKIKLGHVCLYSQKTFSTWRGCQKHMIDSQHTKLLYERGKDQEEFDVFYDFTDADAEFLGTTREEARMKRTRTNNRTKMVVEEEEGDDDDSGEWEDVEEDDEMKDAEEEYEDGVYGAYKDEIAKHGFDITPLGELVFPDGRIIGHRGLSKYYKQRFTSDGSNRTDVRAARRAAGERLYKGQVYDTYQPPSAAVGGDRSASALTLAKVGISRNAGVGGGRASRGILVPSNSNGGNSFTALSLYRYKAAVKKSRREEFQGMRIQQRTTLNMNRMGKKANNLMNGVSVAHAKR